MPFTLSALLTPETVSCARSGGMSSSPFPFCASPFMLRSMSKKSATVAALIAMAHKIEGLRYNEGLRL